MKRSVAEFKDEPIPMELQKGFYYKPDKVPVFIGHYWLSQEQPTLRSKALSGDNFVWVETV